jgi:hypothetical protein
MPGGLRCNVEIDVGRLLILDPRDEDVDCIIAPTVCDRMTGWASKRPFGRRNSTAASKLVHASVAHFEPSPGASLVAGDNLMARKPGFG